MRVQYRQPEIPSKFSYRGRESEPTLFSEIYWDLFLVLLRAVL